MQPPIDSTNGASEKQVNGVDANIACTCWLCRWSAYRHWLHILRCIIVVIIEMATITKRTVYDSGSTQHEYNGIIVMVICHLTHILFLCSWLVRQVVPCVTILLLCFMIDKLIIGHGVCWWAVKWMTSSSSTGTSTTASPPRSQYSPTRCTQLCQLPSKVYTLISAARASIIVHVRVWRIVTSFVQNMRLCSTSSDW